MRISMASAFLVCGMVAANASAQSDEISHHVVPVATPDEVLPVLESLENQAYEDLAWSNPLDTGIDLGTIVNIGRQVWNVIEANQPVLKVQYDYANALPKGAKSAFDLDGFSPMQSRSFRMYGTNLLGMTVYDSTITLIHRYGGHYDGQGNFLDTVAVVPTHVSALWGYSVDLNVNNVATANIGTKDNPIASLVLDMKFSVSTVIKKSQSNLVFEFRGDSADAVEL